MRGKNTTYTKFEKQSYSIYVLQFHYP